MSTAVTVRVAVADPALLAGLAPGTRVAFAYTSGLLRTPALVRIERTAADAALVHDHTPHHGGVVAMVGMHHVEAKADASGLVEVWLTDFYRRDVPLGDLRGTATVDAGGDTRTVPLVPGGGMLAGRGAPIDAPRVAVRVSVALAEGPLEAAFTLPIAADVAGVASVAQTRCAPAAGAAGPRCTIAMSQPVTALAVSPDGGTLVVAVVGGGVSVWHLPDGTLAGGLDPAPPIAVPRGEQPHPEIVNAIVVRPDGTELVLVVEGRVLRYALPGGRLVRVLSGPGDVVRDVAWWPDGSRVVVTAFHDPEAHVFDVDTGKTVARYEVKLEGAAVAVEPAAESVVVGSEAGTLSRFRARDGKRLDTFAASSRAVVSVARLGDALVALTMDGVVRSLDARDGSPRRAVDVGFTPARFAVGPGDRVAVGLPHGRTVLVDPAAGTIVRQLDGPDAQILAVAWHGRTLVTGDATGRVAVWDVEP